MSDNGPVSWKWFSKWGLRFCQKAFFVVGAKNCPLSFTQNLCQLYRAWTALATKITGKKICPWRGQVNNKLEGTLEKHKWGNFDNYLHVSHFIEVEDQSISQYVTKRCIVTIINNCYGSLITGYYQVFSSFLLILTVLLSLSLNVYILDYLS